MTHFVRISGAALCRITHPEQATLLLGISPSMLRKGQQVLKPVGGALEFDLAALPATLTLSLENPDHNEIRFTLPVAQLESFAAWFSTRSGRETDPFRELHEELVQEYAVLPQLKRTDLEMVYRHEIRVQRFSDRTGATGLLTHSFLEIFDVRFINPALEQLLLNVSPASGLYWVTVEQIQRGHLSDEISIQANVLLES